MFRYGLACTLALSATCTLDFDVVGPHGGESLGGSPPTGAGNPSTSGGNGEGGTPIVDCTTDGGRCVPLPDGFQGAVVLSTDGCSGVSEVFDGYEDFSADDATCDCSCVEESAECTLPAQALSFTNTTCAPSNPVGTIALVGSCVAIPAGEMHSVRLDGLPTPPGCVSDNAPPVLPPIDWTDPIAGCSFDSIGCGNDICAPSGERYCFYRQAVGPAVQCPAGFIDTRVIEPRNLVDTRDCICDCGQAVSALCSLPVWSVHGDTTCTDLLNSESGTCVNDAGGGAILSASVTVASNVSCAQSQLPPSGSVIGEPTLQICCSPP